MILAWMVSWAEGKSCVDHVAEVFVLGEVASPLPSEWGSPTELVNSASGGAWVLLWNPTTMEKGRFYQTISQVKSTPARWADTACGYSVPYVSVSAGEYAFVEEHSGSRVPVGIEHPQLVVSADRKTVAVSFGVAGIEYKAEYPVKCTYFSGERPCQ